MGPVLSNISAWLFHLNLRFLHCDVLILSEGDNSVRLEPLGREG